ncbi:MAG: HEAT repeat domain-containing protein [Myxococcales bacterium]|nr:HEAT repeat domain-containing protein [Myxococcales bacterium]MDH3485648.1 HEAT repeat domain-containing protein [Myxococcales bacterium]
MIPPLTPTFEAAIRDVGARGPRFRIAAAERLVDPPTERREEAIEGLLTLTNDPVGAVREAAYEAIGELGAREALPRLLDAFDDGHFGARQAAVLAAGRVAPNAAAEAIEALLEDERPEMRFAAVWTLSRVGHARPERLSIVLGDPDDEVRLLTVQCIGELNANGQVEAIAALLEDRSNPVRFAAAKALVALGDSRGAPTLRAALHGDRAFDAAIGLGDLEDHASLEDLAALARRRFRSPILRAAAARALVRLGDPLGVRVIRNFLRSWRIEARQYAVELVGELGLIALLPDLARALQRSADIEQPIYEATLERLAPKSAEARALLASMRQTNHPP